MPWFDALIFEVWKAVVVDVLSYLFVGLSSVSHENRYLEPYKNVFQVPKNIRGIFQFYYFFFWRESTNSIPCIFVIFLLVNSDELFEIKDGVDPGEPDDPSDGHHWSLTCKISSHKISPLGNSGDSDPEFPPWVFWGVPFLKLWGVYFLAWIFEALWCWMEISKKICEQVAMSGLVCSFGGC